MDCGRSGKCVLSKFHCPPGCRSRGGCRHPGRAVLSAASWGSATDSTPDPVFNIELTGFLWALGVLLVGRLDWVMYNVL